MTELKIVYRNPADLIPYVNNAKTHGAKQIDAIAASIKEFGFNAPILTDGDSGLVAGHGRREAAIKLGLKQVPTVDLSHLSEAQKKAYILADNRLGEIDTSWDMELVNAELDALADMDFDIELTGFDFEIDEPEFEGLTDPDAVPEVDEDSEPVSKQGMIWLCGEHRVMCGDSTSVVDVERLLGEGEVANMLFTDPPYLMDFKGAVHADGSKSFNSKHGEIKNDKMSEKDGDVFLDSINEVIRQKVDGAFYITFYRLGIDKYYASMNRVGLKHRGLIIWDKGNHTLSNSDYMSMYEPMFYGWVNSHKFYGGKNGMDIWRIRRTQKNDLHPTMKPVELVDKAINDGSQINGVCLDLFGGSGTTLISCEKNKRHGRIMELDEKYVDVIVKRWQDFTGKQATLEGDGRTFNEISEL